MGRHRTIDHRQPPRAAGIPMILKGGEKVPSHPVAEVATDEVVQLRALVRHQAGAVDGLEQKLRVSRAELQGLKQALQDARDETTNIRRLQQQPEQEGQLPNRIEIVTVDEIKRSGDTATMTVLADLDGTVGETHMVMPVNQVKILIKQKQAKKVQPDG